MVAWPKYINKLGLTTAMGKQQFTLLVEKGSDGYLIAEVLELPGCRTQAKSYDLLLKRAKEAIELYLDAKKVKADSRFFSLQRIEV